MNGNIYIRSESEQAANNDAESGVNVVVVSMAHLQLFDFPLFPPLMAH